MNRAGARRRVAAVAILAACLAGPGGARAEPLGRLFFTPEERGRMEARRHSGAGAATASPAATTVTVGGVVVRGDGANMVWLNGAPVPERSAPGVRVDRASPANVLLAGPGSALRARVGETVDLATGAKDDRLGGGRLRVRELPAVR